MRPHEGLDDSHQLLRTLGPAGRADTEGLTRDTALYHHSRGVTRFLLWDERPAPINPRDTWA